ncbi:UDP-N-acetylglucosamine--N-acetylmuramyl-(pentapeptide) pyrophosphoryl-undecaprenol N-acetylglucosamine transferase, partial [Patescibacteria group bacterium]|nr:UDP-N-acetylglucosamine--N-acetylmuramyl-(pentapeptide) pyrophosphoryl-undecaprenol N-acetylglucosamine transferase [Patescibacteria group bacterium]
GTLGPVTPLLAVVEAYRKSHPEARFVWVGTKNGPERELVEKYQIPFFVITSGKLRRYFSLKNFIDIFKLIIGFFHSLVFLIQEKPDLIISAGGFVSVPLHWAGVVVGVPAWVHQQDVLPGLANRLIAPFAKKITTAVKDSMKFFSEEKTEWIGNPSRDLSATNSTESRNRFGIPAKAPVLLAMGGGTGSFRVNQIVVEALQYLPEDWHVIHLAGKERPKQMAINATKIFENYRVYDFFTDEMKDAYASADVVVCRGGFASITELAALSKPAIILPMSETHQEENAKFFSEQNAVIVLDEKIATGLELAQVAKDLMSDSAQRMKMGKKLHEILPKTGEKKIVGIIDGLLK